MKAQGIDPRDVKWESDNPTYRVYFWSHPDNASDEWRLTEAASMWEVIAWAEQRVGAQRSFQVFVETIDQLRGTGLVRLMGSDPTATGDSSGHGVIEFHIDD